MMHLHMGLGLPERDYYEPPRKCLHYWRAVLLMAALLGVVVLAVTLPD